MDISSQHERWLKVAANLRVDRKDNIAPHKPLLLLVVAGLAEEGKLTQPVLPLTGELTFRFLAFGAGWQAALVAGASLRTGDVTALPRAEGEARGLARSAATDPAASRMGASGRTASPE